MSGVPLPEVREIALGSVRIGGKRPFVLIAGPCVIESAEICLEVAEFLTDLTRSLDIPYIFKSSYDKANRSGLHSFRGPGLSRGLEILGQVKIEFRMPLLSDVHRFEEIEPAAEVLDILQIPAFLCRQTDFVVGVAKAGKTVNVKKGQFLAPWDMANVIEKIESAGNRSIMITERGAAFGYNNLVADMRSPMILRRMGYPVIFDVTHSLQLPGAQGTSSGGQREFIATLARAAVAAGVDGIFMEVHPNPSAALCDGPNSQPLKELKPLLEQLVEIDRIVKKEK